MGPLWARALTCGAAAGAVLGALIVNPDGVDFTRLSPLPLAVALFVAIPAIFAVVTTLAMEHALRPKGWASSAPLQLLAAPLLVFLFPPLFVVLAVPTLLVLGARQTGERWPAIGSVMHHRAAFWVARVTWGGIAGLGVIALAEDLRALG